MGLPAEELWSASVKRYDQRRNDDYALQRFEYHRGQARRHRAMLGSLVAYHQAEADKWARVLGLDKESA